LKAACNAHEGDEKYLQNLAGKPEGNRPLDTGVDGWMVLKWILQKQGLGIWAAFMCLRIHNGTGLL
jgi:hypothetical protein